MFILHTDANTLRAVRFSRIVSRYSHSKTVFACTKLRDLHSIQTFRDAVNVSALLLTHAVTVNCSRWRVVFSSTFSSVFLTACAPTHEYILVEGFGSPFPDHCCESILIVTRKVSMMKYNFSECCNSAPVYILRV